MRIYLTSFVISLIMMLFSTMVIYHIVDYSDSSATEDNRHYMSTENIANSLFLSFVLGAVVFISAVRIQRPAYKK
ncbi:MULTISPECIES: hypothetical protein [Chryseobacterium]|uniref:hypothetical protein n=1 Tax=Chryseobacterium TaxID=59732 RepID=UPI000FF3E792|nr:MULTISPECIES: hypothetical protein [Chryseobacterium]MDH5036562.1 hypothetical protein [Chryseobacterium cucumeris]QWT84281.1 hypothetical protein KBP46_12105 [Chryseobacterium sp. PCH239]RKE71955.1 hypothetical protein DEU39_4928 [Chryseobacterium sp. AG363]